MTRPVSNTGALYRKVRVRADGVRYNGREQPAPARFELAMRTAIVTTGAFERVAARMINERLAAGERTMVDDLGA
jgi:hypothetical protein